MCVTVRVGYTCGSAFQMQGGLQLTVQAYFSIVSSAGELHGFPVTWHDGWQNSLEKSLDMEVPQSSGQQSLSLQEQGGADHSLFSPPVVRATVLTGSK